MGAAVNALRRIRKRWRAPGGVWIHNASTSYPYRIESTLRSGRVVVYGRRYSCLMRAEEAAEKIAGYHDVDSVTIRSVVYP